MDEAVWDKHTGQLWSGPYVYNILCRMFPAAWEKVTENRGTQQQSNLLNVDWSYECRVNTDVDCVQISTWHLLLTRERQ